MVYGCVRATTWGVYVRPIAAWTLAPRGPASPTLVCDGIPREAEALGGRHDRSVWDIGRFASRWRESGRSQRSMSANSPPPPITKRAIRCGVIANRGRNAEDITHRQRPRPARSRGEPRRRFARRSPSAWRIQAMEISGSRRLRPYPHISMEGDYRGGKGCGRRVRSIRVRIFVGNALFREHGRKRRNGLRRSPARTDRAHGR